jgi:peptidoglycan/xylan/chitin deacetylase (PgdA/CDA1 family)
VREYGCELGWHTWSHPHLTELNDDNLREQLRPRLPFSLADIQVKAFAYPYGNFDERVIQFVKDAGYEEAYAAGPFGDGSQFQKRRRYL